MGNPKQKWTAEEEEALRAGVAKHGTGKWKNIQKDPEFNHFLFTRSNIDLKVSLFVYTSIYVRFFRRIDCSVCNFSCIDGWALDDDKVVKLIIFSFRLSSCTRVAFTRFSVC